MSSKVSILLFSEVRGIDHSLGASFNVKSQKLPTILQYIESVDARQPFDSVIFRVCKDNWREVDGVSSR